MSRFAHVVLANLLFSLTVLDSNSLPHGILCGEALSVAVGEGGREREQRNKSHHCFVS